VRKNQGKSAHYALSFRFVSGVCLAGFPSNQYESGEGMFNKDERTQVDAFPYDPSEIDDQEE
jgi:hypothetical protein